MELLSIEGFDCLKDCGTGKSDVVACVSRLIFPELSVPVAGTVGSGGTAGW